MWASEHVRDADSCNGLYPLENDEHTTNAYSFALIIIIGDALTM